MSTLFNSDIVIAIIGSATTLGGFILKWSLDNKKKKEKSAVSIETPLIQHSIHSNIIEYERMIDTLRIEHASVGRTYIVREVLSEQFDTWKNPIKDFAEKVDGCSGRCEGKCVECNLIYKMAMDMFTHGMEFEQFYKDSRYTNQEQKVLEIFMNKYSEWNCDRIERFKIKIWKICMDNSYYKTCNQKGAVLLDTLDDMLYETIKDAKISMYRLNGELNDLEYKGYKL